MQDIAQRVDKLLIEQGLADNRRRRESSGPCGPAVENDEAIAEVCKRAVIDIIFREARVVDDDTVNGTMTVARRPCVPDFRHEAFGLQQEGKRMPEVSVFGDDQDFR